MNKQITATEARDKLAAVFAEHGYLKQAEDIQGGMSAYAAIQSPLWGAEANVSVIEAAEWGTEREITYAVRIGWSSMYRTVAMTTATLEVYRQALSLAAVLEATIQGFPTVVMTENEE